MLAFVVTLCSGLTNVCIRRNAHLGLGAWAVDWFSGKAFVRDETSLHCSLLYNKNRGITSKMKPNQMLVSNVFTQSSGARRDIAFVMAVESP